MSVHTIRLALLSLTLLAGGCASQPGNYPSLAIRDPELAARNMTAPEPPPPPAPPPRATLDRLGPLAAEARAAHAAFANAAETARARVNAANGALSGTENWSVAQVALADLASRRSTAMIALADLDLLYNDAAIAGESVAEIAPVRDEIVALMAEEDRIVAGLAGQLAR